MLRDLIELAKSDGNFNMAELSYLVWVAHKLDVNQGELKSLMAGDKPVFRQISKHQRLNQFHRLINMMFIDNQIQPEELGKSKELAMKMGLDMVKTNKLLDEIKDNPSVMVKYEDMERVFNEA